MANSNSPIKLVGPPEWELLKLTECTATPNGSVDDEGVELLFSIQIQFKSSDGSRRLVRRSSKMPISSFTEELVFLEMILGKGRIPMSIFSEHPGVLSFACEILLAGKHMACHRPPERTLLRLLACILLFVDRMPNDDDDDIDCGPSESDLVLNMDISDRDDMTDDDNDDNNNGDYVEVEEPVIENQVDARNLFEHNEYSNENGTGGTNDTDNNSNDYIEIEEPVTENQYDIRNFFEHVEFINENGTGRFVPESYDSDENGTGFVDSNQDGIGFVPASEDSIKCLEKVRVKNEPDFDRECSVCLAELEVDSEATRLPCSHLFHGDCILKWLNISKFCPLCRYELPT